MKSAKRIATKAFLILHIIVMAVYISFNLTFLSDVFFSLTARLLRAWIDLDSEVESFSMVMMVASFVSASGAALILWLLQIRGRLLSWITLVMAAMPPLLLVFYWFFIIMGIGDNAGHIVTIAQTVFLILAAGLDIWELVRISRWQAEKPAAVRSMR